MEVSNWVMPSGAPKGRTEWRPYLDALTLPLVNFTFLLISFGAAQYLYVDIIGKFCDAPLPSPSLIPVCASDTCWIDVYNNWELNMNP